jgi:hypothetical protein
MIPLFADLTGKRVVIFGGGKVAARKAAFFATEADVDIISRSHPATGAEIPVRRRTASVTVMRSLKEEARTILGVVERDPRVSKVRALQSMVLGPDDALLALRINFRDGLTTDQIEATIDEVTLALQQSHPVLRHIIIEPES